MIDYKAVTDKIEFEEGFEPCSYFCTEGRQTIGFGFNLESTPMPREVAELWLSMIIAELDKHLSKHDWFRNLDHERRVVIYDMAYQMGISGVFKFGNMIAALAVGNYDEAANQLLDSRYARQTPSRAERNAKIIRGDV